MAHTELPTTIPALVRRAADRYGDAEGLVDRSLDDPDAAGPDPGPGLRLSFAELATRVDTAARALMATGIRPGDRVAVWAPNMWEWAVTALAIHSVGGVLIPLNTRFKGAEAGHILGRSRARLLFTVTDFLQTDYVAQLDDARRAGRADDLASLEELVILRGTVPEGATPFADFVLRADQVTVEESTARAEAVAGDDLCDILFTSGTTGAPKGAMLRHEASIRAYDSWADVVGLREGDRYLIINPFFHAFGLKAGILACLLKGATILPHAVFDVPSVMARVADERITMLPGPPTIFQTILNRPDLDDHDLSSLRLSVTGAATIPVEMIRRMFGTLGFENVVTGYGLTEAHGIATMCRHDDDPETIATTAGRPIPGVEVRLVDDDGEDVPTGQPGEVLVRGYNLMTGYLDDAEATAEAIVDGWLHTGDVGILDDRGNLRITDRKKDMFIVGGFNAYPAEIEQAMSEHPDIASVAVVGVPDDRMGEVAMAYVIPRSGAGIDPDAVIAWCRERMANYKVPRYVELVSELPANASGKVLKYELRQRGEHLVRQGGSRP